MIEKFQSYLKKMLYWIFLPTYFCCCTN